MYTSQDNLYEENQNFTDSRNDGRYGSTDNGRSRSGRRQYEVGSYSRQDMRKIMLAWIFTGALCLVFSLIYGIFSHGVSSPYMTYLCLFPFLAGAVPHLILSVKGLLPLPGQAEVNLYHTGVAALTLSSAMRGIFEIAGTGSVYQVWLMIAGVVLCIAGFAVYLVRSVRNVKRIRAGAY